ncbi:hypothetical protein [Natronogracilivirga saccharolytica]|uniref:Outer membrane protein beta-barrel domain-containing protein n=1 Tax=Natronogracilivirga saccharolytica TaxID=2812953 RepID=A0A8J7RU44_9BACT|nr:hypothetical protein [Natronogracilivirga saccharolytica]MBP3193002.1 hypothetical protein [Natronogracilivirga saccharolytica]
MTKLLISKITFLIFLLMVSTAVSTAAQVSLGVDAMNRYVWRGFDFGDSPSIQPELNYTNGGFEVGVWGAFATNGNPAGQEISPWVAYTAGTDAGDFTFIATDYTFPGPGGTWPHDSDSHAIELGLGYEGFINAFAGVFVYGDDDNSMYVELGYDFRSVGIFAGFSPYESAEYGTDGFGLINVGLSYDYDMTITPDFDLGMTSSLVWNPESELLHLVFGISL